MVMAKMYIKKYDWTVDIYYHVDCYYTDEILSILEGLGATDKVLEDAYNNMKDCKLNTGFTYTNSNIHRSIIVISNTSEPSQFLNTFTHELFHFVIHLCEYYDIDKTSEDAAYLMGDVAKALYITAKPFLCNCNCNHK